MAQLVEQRIRNAQVIGSSPITSSTKIPMNTKFVGFFFFPGNVEKGKMFKNCSSTTLKITGKGVKGLVTCFGFKSHHSHTLFP